MQLIKTELTCLGVLAYLTYFFLQQKRVPTAVNRLTRVALQTGIASICLGAVASLLTGGLRGFPLWLVRLCNQLHLISLCVFLCIAACYLLCTVTSTNLLTSNSRLSLAVPVICVCIMVFVLPSYSKSVPGGSYVYGPMTYTYQFSVLFYMGMCVYHLFKHREELGKKGDGLLAVILTIILLSIVQVFVPSMMLGCMGVVMLALCMVLTADNPDEYLSMDHRFFNQRAFELIASDNILRGKPITVVFAVYRELAVMEEKFGADCVKILFLQLQQYIKSTFKMEMYMPVEGCIAIPVDDPKRAETMVFALQQRFEREWHVLEVPLNVYANVISLSMPEPYSNVDDLMSAVMEQSEKAQKPVVVIDAKTGLKNKQAFERALAVIHHTRKQYSSIYYLITDVQGMHKINKSEGYIAGDKLLKDCADVLKQAAGDDIEVYRVGGDEFAMLLLSKTDTQVRDVLDRIQELREACNKERGQIPLEISVGYSRYYEDSDRTFSSMITRAEFQMNNLKKHMSTIDPDMYNITRLGTKLLK